MKLGESPLVGVFRERIALHPGERLDIRFDPERVHLFDKASGQRLA
jgi:multiple sugar transport system ATP-binding protein